MDEIFECAEKALNDCLNLRRQEQLLVLCDPACYEIGRAFYNAGENRCKEAVFVMFPSRKYDGNEPPAPIGDWIGQFDVAVIPTSKAFSHSKICKVASDHGTRIAMLPGITNDVFLRTMKTDWRKLGIYTRKIAGKLSAANKVHIKSDSGTDLSFETRGSLAIADDGRIMSKGESGDLPAGEVYISPLNDSTEGILVIDQSFSLVDGVPKEPVILHVKEGKVIKIEGHNCIVELDKLFVKYRNASRIISEFGVGTHDEAVLSGSIFEDKKVRGTVHIAIGGNCSCVEDSNSVPIHLEGVMRQSSVWLDNKLWIDNGVFL